jgi:hypothetical protein
VHRRARGCLGSIEQHPVPIGDAAAQHLLARHLLEEPRGQIDVGRSVAGEVALRRQHDEMIHTVLDTPLDTRLQGWRRGSQQLPRHSARHSAMHSVIHSVIHSGEPSERFE